MRPDPLLISRILRAIAAAEIMPRFQHALATKKTDGSLVTDADHATQQGVIEALQRAFPRIPLLGEEMQEPAQRRHLESHQDGLWILDPLDGTSNFASGFPAFALSLAYVEQGQAKVGVILDPVRDECFTAVQGAGAFLNGQAIRAFAAGPQLSDCQAMIDMKRLPPQRIPALFRAGGFRSQRNLGSVALDWCWLAAGRYQLYLHGGQKLWDYAAGRLIASEAGASSRLFEAGGAAETGELSLRPRLAVGAANERLLAQWIAFLQLPFEPS